MQSGAASALRKDDQLHLRVVSFCRSFGSAPRLGLYSPPRLFAFCSPSLVLVVIVLRLTLGLTLALLDQKRPLVVPGYLRPLIIGNRHRQAQVLGLAPNDRVEVVSGSILVGRRQLALLTRLKLTTTNEYG